MTRASKYYAFIRWWSSLNLSKCSSGVAILAQWISPCHRSILSKKYICMIGASSPICRTCCSRILAFFVALVGNFWQWPRCCGLLVIGLWHWCLSWHKSYTQVGIALIYIPNDLFPSYLEHFFTLMLGAYRNLFVNFLLFLARFCSRVYFSASPDHLQGLFLFFCSRSGSISQPTDPDFLQSWSGSRFFPTHSHTMDANSKEAVVDSLGACPTLQKWNPHWYHQEDASPGPRGMK